MLKYSNGRNSASFEARDLSFAANGRSCLPLSTQYKIVGEILAEHTGILKSYVILNENKCVMYVKVILVNQH